jgi:hypothetical protein
MSGVYFGNKDKQLWIKAPKTGLKANNSGKIVQNDYLSGRSSIKRSQASKRTYDPSWLGYQNSEDGTSIYVLKDFADGLYGQGPFYFLDPYAIDQNILPPHWAAPMLTEKDWPSLAPGFSANFVVEDVPNNYPMSYASYEVAGTYQSTNKLTIIIPKDYALNFGWHGPTAGSSTGVRVVPYLRATGEADTALNPAKLPTNSTTRTNLKLKGDTYSYVEIFIATSGAAEVNITGMIAQILPETSSVAPGGFISGRGTTAIEFAQIPEIEYYSAAIGDGLIGLSASWVEV